MVSPAFEQAALITAAALVLMAPVGILFGYRNYSEEQRTAASELYHCYLFGLACVSIIGTATFMWILAEGVLSVWITAILPVVPLPVIVIQWKLHRKIGYTGWFGTA